MKTALTIAFVIGCLIVIGIVVVRTMRGRKKESYKTSSHGGGGESRNNVEKQ
ncbi:hypothetical protein [Carboxylicivirga marina]|uniref:Uncharacterized protein n=1 Tax=Carboxylicivirga marina TaxID=2800988 RepID=A0ABS1HGB9_9BACT|nr:hypothetical protein [Carboxylicivirga marina]MBK3516715.1 hypothetical protein [Carboxylicivirga marina]